MEKVDGIEPTVLLLGTGTGPEALAAVHRDAGGRESGAQPTRLIHKTGEQGGGLDGGLLGFSHWTPAACGAKAAVVPAVLTSICFLTFFMEPPSE